jgi:hypothetical protein
MSEQAGWSLLERGVMPVAALKDRDAVRLIRLQSVAEPLTPLAGWWSRP